MFLNHSVAESARTACLIAAGRHKYLSNLHEIAATLPILLHCAALARRHLSAFIGTQPTPSTLRTSAPPAAAGAGAAAPASTTMAAAAGVAEGGSRGLAAGIRSPSPTQHLQWRANKLHELQPSMFKLLLRGAACYMLLAALRGCAVRGAGVQGAVAALMLSGPLLARMWRQMQAWGQEDYWSSSRRRRRLVLWGYREAAGGGGGGDTGEQQSGGRQKDKDG